MKKIIFSIFLILATSQICLAQDLNNWVSGLSLAERSEYQLVDRNMLDATIAMAPNAIDSTGALASPKVPSFMGKLDSIDLFNLTSCPDEVKSLFLKDLDNIQDGNGYETLINAIDDTDKVRIIAKKEGTIIPHIYIFAIDGDSQEIVVVRMNGKMDESDLADILKQQQK